MKKIFIATLSILLISIPSAFCAAQTGVTLKGKVQDKATGEPVGWATVALMKADSTIVGGTSCDQFGRYELSAHAGNYLLTASLIGYKDFSREVSLRGVSSEAEPILLETDTQMLKGATVTEKVQLIEMKLDKVVMNIKESAFAQGSNALDLMKKAPGVTIDKDGNIKLNGKSVSVWIDGRPSYMDGKTLEALLRSTGSESIDKFEIMENPSSKYDAAGQGGIINIKTKRNLIRGFNGSLGLNGGLMHFREIGGTPFDQSAWANLGYRTKKVNTFLNVNEGIYNTPVKTVNDLTMETADFRQVGTSLIPNSFKYCNVKTGFDWFIDQKNTFGVILNVPVSNFSFNSKESGTEQYIAGILVQKTDARIINDPTRGLRHNVNLNFTHIFDESLNSEITANIDYCHNKSESYSSQEEEVTPIPDPGEKYYQKKEMSSLSKYNIYSAKADYQTLAWKKFMLETGAKWALSQTDFNSLEISTYNPVFPQSLLYRENIGAIYASLAGQFSAKWSFKAGLRGEYTHTFGDWKTTGDVTTRNYFDVFPTIYIGYTPNEKWRLGANYTRRINRPSYDELNPAKTYVDAKTYILGNPDILPEYSNNLSISAGYSQHLSLALSYSSSKNVINQIPSFEPDGTEYLTWGNMGKNRIGAASFNIAALPIGKWLQWTLNANALYLNTFTVSDGKTRNSFSGRFYTDFTFILPKDWRIDLDGFLTTPMVYGYYKVHSVKIANIAAKKTLLEGRMTLTLKLEDIFRSMDNDIELLGSDASGAKVLFRQKYYTQKASLGITWNFGKAQSPMKQRKVGEMEEMSRVGSGNGASIGNK